MKPAVPPSVFAALAAAVALLQPVSAAQTDPPAPRWTQRWVFSQAAAGWSLQAAGPGADAAWADGALRLAAALQTGPQGQVSCPVAEARTAFGDAITRQGGDRWLRLTLQVRRWDLGLGHLDDHVPLLEVVHHGERTVLGVAGFTRMPDQVELRWDAGRGWRAVYGGQERALQPRSVRPDRAAPGLRLWTDGCSQGMRQALELTALGVAVG